MFLQFFFLPCRARHDSSDGRSISNTTIGSQSGEQTKQKTHKQTQNKQQTQPTKNTNPQKEEIAAGETVKRSERAPLKASLRCTPQ